LTKNLIEDTPCAPCASAASPSLNGSLWPCGWRRVISYSSVVKLNVYQRVAALALLLTMDASLIRHVSERGYGGATHHFLLSFALTFTVYFLGLGYLKFRNEFRRISGLFTRQPISPGLLFGHLCAVITFIAISRLSPEFCPPGFQGHILGGIWCGVAVLTFATAGFAFVSPKLLLQVLRTPGRTLWVYASIAAALSNPYLLPVNLIRGWAWTPSSVTTNLTLDTVRALLLPFVSNVVADPATMTVGTQRFTVIIADRCSGIEGMGLMLVFTAAWLLFLRREFRFPQALVLFPASLPLIWILNAVRIAALILIGHAGAPAVALGGFHSQAGWIAFNAAALGLSVGARRLRWLRAKLPERPLPEDSAGNPTAAYLMPFLMILAAAMLSRAASGSFEWLYPLRFFCAAGALWLFRSKYAGLNWSFGWSSLVCGGLVFGMWLGLDRILGIHPDNVAASALQSLSAPARISWLAFRTLGAVITVPIAEELAFRGFLIRRLISFDFDSLDARHFTWLSFLISSVAFGLLHGDRWLAGTIAGLLYAAVFLRRGRIGDAVVAHVTTNALLAGYVLLSGNLSLW
jgi:exosortase E/protease (VPEID-CTERM system)